MLKLLYLSVSLLLAASSSDAFSGAAKISAINKKELANEAVTFFDKIFPFDSKPTKSVGLGGFGMPDRGLDLDALREDKPQGKRLTDISEPRARQAFGELAKLYGDSEALEMVKTVPVILCFNYKTWAESLNEWDTIFGLENAQAMVRRNPGLLAVKPKDAATTTGQAMIFSYIIAITRPFSKVLLPLLLFLLLSPAIEYYTGIPLRATLFGPQ